MLNSFKSDQERDFYILLTEAEQAGWVENIIYEPESFVLLPRQNMNGRCAFQSWTYTPDFRFKLTQKGEVALPKWVISDDGYVWFEIKGDFDRVRKDDRYVTAERKMMFAYHHKYINYLKLNSGFKTLWLPAHLWFTPKGKIADNKWTKSCLTFDQYCASIKGIQGDLF